MSYKIIVDNEYQDGTMLKFDFNTTSGFFDASKEVDLEVLTRRVEQGKDPFEKSIRSTVTYQPKGV